MGTISNQRNAFDYENQGETTTVKGSAQVAEDGHIESFSGQLVQNDEHRGNFHYSESGNNVNFVIDAPASNLSEVMHLLVSSVADIKTQMAE